MMQQVDVVDGQLQVWTEGDGQPVLFVHGFPLDHRMWCQQFPALAASCRIIAPDLRGFGGSSAVPGELFTMEQFADDLAVMLDRLQVDQPVVFCGLSMGGYIAWPFWQHHRDRLKALILCDTRAASDRPEVAQGRRYMAARVLREGVAAATSDLLQKLFVPASLKAGRPEIEQVREVMLATPPHSIAAAQRGMAVRPDMTHCLADIDLPVLGICGREDVLTPPSEMQAMVAAIPRAAYCEIADAGHMAPLERPKEVNHAIQQFLRS